MSRNKKLVYATVISVAGGALLVDRLRAVNGWGGPATALGAAAPSTTPGSTAARVEPLDEHRPIRVSPARFPAVGADRSRAGQIRNVFTVTPVAQASLQATPIDGTDEASAMPPVVDSDPRSMTAFAQTHRLTGVMLNDRIRYAVVNGLWVLEGQEVDGCTLVKIEGEKAWFRCIDGVAELSVGAEPN